jgi:hypothetical protein
MNRCRPVAFRVASLRSFAVLVTVVIVCLAAAWRGTGVADSVKSQFTVEAIPSSAVHHGWQAPHIRNRNGTSANWSGYAVYKDGSGKGKNAIPATTFSDVQGSWVVPTVIGGGSSNTYSSAWVGIDGYNDGTVEQIGTEQDWSNGSAVYYAWYEMYPRGAYKIKGFSVSAGDTITARVQYLSKNSFRLTITNVTTDDSFSTTQSSGSAQRLSAEWVMEAPWMGGVLPLANFGKIDFSDCQATSSNGTVGTPASWTSDEIVMETSDGTVKAQPSGGGSSFSVSWEHE